MPAGRQLQAAAERQARLLDTLVEAFALEIERALVLVNRRVRSLVGQFRLESGRFVRTQQDLGRAIRLRQDLRDALKAAGIDDLTAAALDAPLDRLTKSVLESSRIARTFRAWTPFDVNALVGIRDIELAKLLKVADNVAITLQQSVLDGVLGSRPVADLLTDIDDVLDGTIAEARKIYDTAVSTYVRRVEILQSTNAPDELFLYVGPVDELMRPFCAKWVGKVEDRASIDQMDNGMTPDVMLTGGGWNCRHRWMRVSALDSEIRDLAGTGRREASVSALLAQVTPKARKRAA